MGRLVKKVIVVLSVGALLGLLTLTSMTLEIQLRAQPTGEEKTAPAQQTSPGWREQNAYTLGVQAYIYCFPWVYMPEARWLRTQDMYHTTRFILARGFTSRTNPSSCPPRK